MKNRFLKYLGAQLKRGLKYCPIVLLFTIIISVSFAVIFVTMFARKDNQQMSGKLNVALVGNMEDTFIEIGIATVQSMDSSKGYVEFVQLEEEEAEQQLMDGKLDGYFVIPEGFVDSIITGENIPLTFVTKNNPTYIEPIISNEVIRMVSQYVIQSQNGIYGLADIVEKYDMWESYSTANRDMNIRYIDTVLGRNKFHEKIEVEDYSAGGFETYYLCVLGILLLLLCGMACPSMAVKTNMSLQRILHASGFRVPGLVIGEYIPFLFVVGIPFVVVMLIGGSKWLVAGLPILILLTMMQFLLYEFANNLVSGTFLQLFVTLIMAFISGFFFPSTMFPDVLQQIGKYLPTGISLEYMRNYVSGVPTGNTVWFIWGYVILFVVATLGVRKYKIRSSRYE